MIIKVLFGILNKLVVALDQEKVKLQEEDIKVN
jgi:hypothetical protein